MSNAIRSLREMVLLLPLLLGGVLLSSYVLRVDVVQYSAHSSVTEICYPGPGQLATLLAHLPRTPGPHSLIKPLFS